MEAGRRRAAGESGGLGFGVENSVGNGAVQQGRVKLKSVFDHKKEIRRKHLAPSTLEAGR
jgi:hypothetical protein